MRYELKKIICLISAVSVFAAMTGCGREHIVLDSSGGEYYVEEKQNDLSEKVKPAEEVSEDGSIVTKPPKIRDDAASAEVDNTPSNDGEDTNVSSGEGDRSPADGDNEPTAPDPYRYHLEGIVLEVGKNSVLINEVDLRRIELACEPTQLAGIAVGDEITVRYDGVLAESYPQQGTAHSVEVTKKADKKYELKRFTYRDKYFTVMVPEGWSDRVIDYPQEGDFTDWGIRLQPDGAKGSIDISWHSAFAIREPYDKRKITINGYEVTEYSKSGIWKFMEYTKQSYLLNNNFDPSGEFSKYRNDIDIIVNSLEFI